jgi:hypothetical protein
MSYDPGLEGVSPGVCSSAENKMNHSGVNHYSVFYKRLQTVYNGLIHPQRERIILLGTHEPNPRGASSK